MTGNKTPLLTLASHVSRYVDNSCWANLDPIPAGQPITTMPSGTNLGLLYDRRGICLIFIKSVFFRHAKGNKCRDCAVFRSAESFLSPHKYIETPGTSSTGHLPLTIHLLGLQQTIIHQ